MESARRIIAALLAIACMVQPLLPCRCRLASRACGAECCAAIESTGKKASSCERKCSDSHHEHRQSSHVETHLSESHGKVPAPAPTREKCPNCICQSWLALPNSPSQDTYDSSIGEDALNERMQFVHVATHVEPFGGLRIRVFVLSQIRLHCRMQV